MTKNKHICYGMNHSLWYGHLGFILHNTFPTNAHTVLNVQKRSIRSNAASTLMVGGILDLKLLFNLDSGNSGDSSFTVSFDSFLSNANNCTWVISGMRMSPYQELRTHNLQIPQVNWILPVFSPQDVLVYFLFDSKTKHFVYRLITGAHSSITAQQLHRGQN